MLDYGKVVERSIIKDGNALYSKIVDENGNVSFIELYDNLEDYKEAKQSLASSLDMYYGSIETERMLYFKLEYLIKDNAKMVRLLESATHFIKEGGPAIKNEVQLNDLIANGIELDDIVKSYAKICRENPQWLYNHEPALFESPTFVRSVINGDKTLMDKYGHDVHMSLHRAYETLMIHSLLAGSEKIPVPELSRYINGFEKNNNLTEKFAENQDANVLSAN